MAASWLTQFTATLHRNFLIKLRDGSQTLQEIFLPVYIIMLLIIVKLVQPDVKEMAVPMQPAVDAVCSPVNTGTASACWRFPNRDIGENTLAYAPQGHPQVEGLIMKAVEEMSSLYSSLPTLTSAGFETEADLMEFYQENPATIFAAVIFEVAGGGTELPQELVYHIRINGTYMPSTTKMLADKDECRPPAYDQSILSDCQAHKYLTSGFLALQTSIAHAAAILSVPDSPDSGIRRSTHAMQLPLPPYHKSFSSTNFQLFAAMYMVWALAPVLQVTLIHTVHEKQMLLKDCMLVMGLRESVYWLGCLIPYAVMAIVTSTVIVVAAKLTTLFSYSNMFVMFVIIYPYTLSLIAMALALSAMFTTVRSAAPVAGGLMLLGSLAIWPIDLQHWVSPLCFLLSLFSPIGFSIAIDIVTRAEGTKEGVHWYSFWTTDVGVDPGDPTSPMSLGAIVLMMVLDTVLYAIAAWYLDNVWPHPDRGPKRQWNFVLQKSYWFPSSAIHYSSLADRVSQTELDDNSLDMEELAQKSAEDGEAHQEEQNPNIEPVGPQLARKAAIVISKLQKVYPNRQIPWWQFWAKGRIDGRGRDGRGGSRGNGEGGAIAVKDLSLKLYEGQTFAFLGHSGAGKTTIMSVLAGLSQPSGGEVRIYGHSQSDSGHLLQSLVGVCPANNIFLDYLTAREQLRYFAAIKGELIYLGRDAQQDEPEGRSQQQRMTSRQVAEEMLVELGLAEDGDKRAYALTPAQQRKLSLAIALVGNPQVAILDQPTKVLDPISRKQVWDALARRRRGRMVVFTTHSMEEADVMADRKAIISHGQLKCCGTSLFLRNRFGLSYLLHVSKAELYNGAAVVELIHKHIPSASLVPTVRQQDHVTFQLPLGKPAETKDLLMELTLHAQELGVEEGALEATTLEEVFLQFEDDVEEEASKLDVQYKSAGQNYLNSNNIAEEEGENLLSTDPSRMVSAASLSYQRRTGAFRTQAMAFWKSRMLLYRRNIRSTFSTFALPLGFALVALLIQAASHVSSPRALELRDRDLANSIPIFYSVNDEIQVPTLRSLLDQLGPNHSYLNSTELMLRFTEDQANTELNGAGSQAVGVKFDFINLTASQAEYTVLYQPWHIHQLPIVAATFDNLLLQAFRINQSFKEITPISLRVISHPLPGEDYGYLFGYFVAVVIAEGLLLVPPVFGAQVVVDMESGFRTMFHVAGLRGMAYWLATFFADLTLFLVSGILILILGLMFGHTPFLPAAIPALIVLLTVAMPALILLAYVLSFALRGPQSTISLLSFIFLLLGIIPYFLTIAFTNSSPFSTFHAVLAFIDPPYALIAGFHYVAGADISFVREEGNFASSTRSVGDYLAWGTHVPTCILGLLAFSVFALVLLIRFENRAFNPQETGQGDLSQLGTDDGQEEDEDVLKEKENVQTNAAKWDEVDGQEGDLILCSSMGKSFTTSTGIFGLHQIPGGWAVKNFWLSIPRGEIVVLLGGENAGKSTVLRCLAGATPVSYGDALINGASVRYSYQRDSSAVSYCPQGEVLYASLTVREHLLLFAAIKGLPQPHSIAVEEVMASLKLNGDADLSADICKASTLRRLSLAISLLGNSPVLLLDEPSQGLDVASRRELWALLAKESKQRATLICTHSVEVAEALGARVGIMVKGELKCLGFPQQLKQRYGSTYTLLISAAPERLPAIREFITTLFPTPLEEEDDFMVSSTPFMGRGRDSESGESALDCVGGSAGGQARFKVPVEGLRELAMLLHELETRREPLRIESYNVSQPTLQQVFHRLSRGGGSLRQHMGFRGRERFR